MFLKNEKLDPVKIKLHELMSYKRLGTGNHLAYCSSMKTVKSFKTNNDSCHTIDSKQISKKDINSKKLIRIVNKKVYEELVHEDVDEEQMRKTKSKLKGKKEGRVRFDQ